MDEMYLELLYDICQTIKYKDSLNPCRKIRIKLTQNKIDKLYDEFFKADTFTISGCILGFLNSFNIKPGTFSDVKTIDYFNKNTMVLKIHNYEIQYNPPKTINVTINDFQGYFFTIDGKNNNSMINKLWDEIEVELREYYKTLIERLSEEF